jgi:hypothetical protein
VSSYTLADRRNSAQHLGTHQSSAAASRLITLDRRRRLRVAYLSALGRRRVPARDTPTERLQDPE